MMTFEQSSKVLSVLKRKLLFSSATLAQLTKTSRNTTSWARRPSGTWRRCWRKCHGPMTSVWCHGCTASTTRNGTNPSAPRNPDSPWSRRPKSSSSGRSRPAAPMPSRKRHTECRFPRLPASTRFIRTNLWTRFTARPRPPLPPLRSPAIPPEFRCLVWSGPASAPSFPSTSLSQTKQNNPAYNLFSPYAPDQSTDLESLIYRLSH